MSEVIKQSAGGTLVINMDYMMKHYETRDRESSREHYGKRVIVVYGALAKYKHNDNFLFKRARFMSPERDGTQDAKAALANLDIICKCVKQEQIWNNTRNLIILCDNDDTYSAVVFHVAAFDVARSCELKLIGLIHNEDQDGKTELDSSFYHFKFQLKKLIRKTKGAVLTPYEMARAMEYSNGIDNSRFDILQFSRNRLDELFYDQINYYGKLNTRVKQVLPQNVDEISLNNSETHDIFEYSSISRFNFKNGIVKKIDRHMES